MDVWWGSDELSDREISLEDGCDGKLLNKRVHSLVLATASTYFRALFARWSGGSSAVVERLPRGSTTTDALAVIEFMYTGKLPRNCKSGIPDLLRLHALCDYWGVAGCAEECLARCRSTPLGRCDDIETLRLLFGDAQAVLTDVRLLTHFRTLGPRGVTAWAAMPGLEVDCEETVIILVHEWCREYLYPSSPCCGIQERLDVVSRVGRDVIKSLYLCDVSYSFLMFLTRSNYQWLKEPLHPVTVESASNILRCSRGFDLTPVAWAADLRKGPRPPLSVARKPPFVWALDVQTLFGDDGTSKEARSIPFYAHGFWWVLCVQEDRGFGLEVAECHSNTIHAKGIGAFGLAVAECHSNTIIQARVTTTTRGLQDASVQGQLERSTGATVEFKGRFGAFSSTSWREALKDQLDVDGMLRITASIVCL